MNMLAPQKITVSIGALSRATRIPVNTIRTWEKRYGFPQASRTESGHRLYLPEVITHLRLVARALEQGHRAGQVLSLDMAALRSLIGDNQSPLPVKHTGTQIDAWLESARTFDADALMGSFRRVVAQAGLVQFVLQDCPRLLHAIGRAWEENRLEIEHEHFASECLRDFLTSEWRPMVQGSSERRVLLATLPGETHSLGLHLAACLYAFFGYEIYFVGTNLPVSNLIATATELKVSVMSLSVSVYAEERSVVSNLATLREGLPVDVRLHLGGLGVPKGVSGAMVFGELRELYTYLDEAR